MSSADSSSITRCTVSWSQSIMKRMQFYLSFNVQAPLRFEKLIESSELFSFLLTLDFNLLFCSQAHNFLSSLSVGTHALLV